MGISNRDYYREDPPGRQFGSRPNAGLSAVGWILAITIAAQFAQWLVPPRPEMLQRFGDSAPSAFTEFFWLQIDAFQSGHVWGLVTYAFLHDERSLLHILVNMFVFYMVAPDLLQRRGPRELIAVYLASAAFSGAAFLVWAFATNSGNPVVGASGAVNALVVIFALANPKATLYLFGIVPMRGVGLVVVKVLFDLLPMLSNPQPVDGGTLVAHSAHLGGILFGVLYQRFGWYLTSGWRGGLSWSDLRRRFRRKPQLKVHRPPVDDGRFAERVDELLDKVARQGEASLTDEERGVLIEASRRARERMSK
jgi:membrane associated rhomboid family serine protease